MLRPYSRSARYYDRIYAFKAYRDEAEAVRAFVAREHPEAATLLEVACGTGGHLAFLRDAFKVEGFDRSAEMLARARTKLPDVPLHEGDMRGFDLGRTFDVVACLFSGIGYVRSVQELDAAVASMARHLAPGGVLLIEPWFTEAQWNPGRVHGELMVDEPDLKIGRFSVSGQRGRFAITPMHHVVADPSGIESFVEEHELFLASEAEYATALRSAQLRDVHFVGDLLARGLWVGRRP